MPELGGYLLTRYDRDIADFEPFRWCHEKGRIERCQRSAARRCQVVAVDRPVLVEFLDKRLQSRFLVVAEIILLQRRLPNCAMPNRLSGRALLLWKNDQPGDPTS